MAYNQQLADRIREQLQDLENIEEKEMMGGLTFLLNGKMSVGIIKDEMMCRIDPALYDQSLEKTGCHEISLGTVELFEILKETFNFLRPDKGFLGIADEEKPFALMK